VKAIILGLLTLATCGSPGGVPAKPAASAPPAATTGPAAPVAVAPTAVAQMAAATPVAETVRVAHVPSTLFAPLYVAIERGYLQEQGITAQLDQVTAGQDAMALAAQGQLDVVVGGFAASTFNAIDRGLDIRVVGSMGAQPQTGFPSAVMVREDLLSSRQVQSLADLRRKKVALAGGAGSTGSYWMATKLREGGLNLRDVEIVNLAFPDMVAGFKTGAIDAALPPAPFTTEILRDRSADVFGGPFPAGAAAVGAVYGPAFRRDHDSAARRLFVGLVRGARDVQGDQVLGDANLEIFSKYTRLAIDTLRNMDPYGYHPDLQPDAETLMDMQRVFFDAGILVYNPPLTPDRILDETYSRAAVAQLGPYRP
jgi:NitT/TauT family transport system substrate-binding protein